MRVNGHVGFSASSCAADLFLVTFQLVDPGKETLEHFPRLSRGRRFSPTASSKRRTLPAVRW
jgi:hypothetical protein